jgi:hypothetical protein
VRFTILAVLVAQALFMMVNPSFLIILSRPVPIWEKEKTPAFVVLI